MSGSYSRKEEKNFHDVFTSQQTDINTDFSVQRYLISITMHLNIYTIKGFYKPCQSKFSETMLLNSVLSFIPISYHSEYAERPLKDNHPTPLILDCLINFDIFPFCISRQQQQHYQIHQAASDASNLQSNQFFMFIIF